MREIAEVVPVTIGTSKKQQTPGDYNATQNVAAMQCPSIMHWISIASLRATIVYTTTMNMNVKPCGHMCHIHVEHLRFRIIQAHAASDLGTVFAAVLAATCCLANSASGILNWYPTQSTMESMYNRLCRCFVLWTKDTE